MSESGHEFFAPGAVQKGKWQMRRGPRGPHNYRVEIVGPQAVLRAGCGSAVAALDVMTLTAAALAQQPTSEEVRDEAE